MGIYGSPSAKPHKAWSNDPALLREIHNRAGHISKAEMHSIKEAQQNALVKVAEKSNGKRAYSGQKKSPSKQSAPSLVLQKTWLWVSFCLACLLVSCA